MTHAVVRDAAVRVTVACVAVVCVAVVRDTVKIHLSVQTTGRVSSEKIPVFRKKASGLRMALRS